MWLGIKLFDQKEFIKMYTQVPFKVLNFLIIYCFFIY